MTWEELAEIISQAELEKIENIGDDEMESLEISGHDIQDIDTEAADAVDMETALTVAEAAAAIGVSSRRVVALLSNSALVGRKRAGRWFIDAESVNLFARTARKAGNPNLKK